MLRQTAVIIAFLLSGWIIGVGILALDPHASAQMDAAIDYGRGPLYLASMSTSAYQDPTGRFTVYVRTPLRTYRQVAELERD
jgi:hypothetical protein